MTEEEVIALFIERGGPALQEILDAPPSISGLMMLLYRATVDPATEEAKAAFDRAMDEAKRR